LLCRFPDSALLAAAGALRSFDERANRGRTFLLSEGSALRPAGRAVGAPPPGFGAPAPKRRSASRDMSQLGGLHIQIIPFRKARGLLGRETVVKKGRFLVARLLVEMSPDGRETVVPSEPRILIEGLKKVEAGTRAVDHRHRDGAVQKDHGVFGH